MIGGKYKPLLLPDGTHRAAVWRTSPPRDEREQENVNPTVAPTRDGWVSPQKGLSPGSAEGGILAHRARSKSSLGFARDGLLGPAARPPLPQVES